MVPVQGGRPDAAQGTLCVMLQLGSKATEVLAKSVMLQVGFKATEVLATETLAKSMQTRNLAASMSRIKGLPSNQDFRAPAIC